MWYERRRDWWREVLSSVKVLTFFILLPRRLLRLVFVCLSAIACELGLDLCHFDAEQAFSQVWKRMFLCDYPLVVAKCPVK